MARPRPRHVPPGHRLVAAAVCSLAACAPGDTARDARWPELVPERPRRVHVVLALVDTLRADRLGSYGYPRPTSPRLDELAKESFVFTAASGAAPWTLPSVVSMMTSRLPLEHGVVERGQVLREGTVTLPRRMAELGFLTASFVRNPYASSASGLDRGWDHHENEPGVREVDLGKVAGWLDAHPDARHFLYLHSMEPHHPYQVADSYVERFGSISPKTRRKIHGLMKTMRDLSRTDFGAGDPLGTADLDEEQGRAIASLAELRDEVDDLYDASVAWADHDVGELVDLLKQRGMWQDTLFVMVSDHGEELFDHGGWLHHRTLYAELLRIPMILHFPGQTRGGRFDSPVSLIDVFPTLMEYLGAGTDGLEGRSLFEVLRGSGPGTPRVVANRDNRMLFYGPDVRARGNVNVAVEEGTWKGIWNLENGTFELYSLTEDPTDQEDVARGHPDTCAELLELARAWRNRLGDGSLAAEAAELDAPTLDQLRELGYAR